MMKKIKITTVVGARPQFIKAAMLSRLLQKSEIFEERIIHTGQHFDENMSEVFFKELNIPAPSHNLNIHSLSCAPMIGQMLISLEKDFQEYRPDILLVYGDTNSTLAGALTARKMDIPIIHIEAGLRRHNKSVPEEVNRLLTDHISDLLFAPSETAVRNLGAEGLSNNVHNVGDIMLDAYKYYGPQANNRYVPEGSYALATIHRAENTDHPDNLRQLFEGFSRLPLPIVIPLHPRTKSALEKIDYRFPANVKCIPPIGYLEMLGLINQATYILTDSGGLQKEAAFANKRCLILRDQTPWVELIDHGYARIVGTCSNKLIGAHDWAQSSMENMMSLYGTGRTAQDVLRIMEEWSRGE